MTRLFIEPTDVLIFRTGLPFDAGTDSYAPGIFPPAPETLQGALREYLARTLSGGTSLKETFAAYREVLGDDQGNVGRFRMRGPFLARRNEKCPHVIERLYPAPADVLMHPCPCHLLQPDTLTSDTEDTVLANWPDDANTHRLQTLRTSDKDNSRFWITTDDLIAWQSGDPDKVATIKGIGQKALWSVEPRMGIKHQRGAKVVDEGFLYQLEFIRLHEGVGLDVDVWIDDGHTPAPDLDRLLTSADASGWGRLGGEGRTVRSTVAKPAPVIPTPTSPPGSDEPRFKLYCATPAIFNGGWLSSMLCEDGVTLVTAALPRYQSIGGWQMNLNDQRGTHKPLRRYVPAGSVYYCTGSPTSLRASLTDEQRASQIGFGVYYTGVW